MIHLSIWLKRRVEWKHLAFGLMAILVGFYPVSTDVWVKSLKA